MLQDLIREIIEESSEVVTDIDTLSKDIANSLKDSAKRIFFEGKIQDLKDFIFDLPNPHHDAIRQRLSDDLREVTSSGDVFISSIKNKIAQRIEHSEMQKNIDSLLDILDYGHLKDLLKMFKL